MGGVVAVHDLRAVVVNRAETHSGLGVVGVEIGVMPVATLEVRVLPARRGHQLEGVGVRVVGVLGDACQSPLDDGVCGRDVHVRGRALPKVALDPPGVAAQAQAGRARAVWLGCGPCVLQVGRSSPWRPRLQSGFRRRAFRCRTLHAQLEHRAYETTGKAGGLRRQRPHLLLAPLRAADHHVGTAALGQAHALHEAREVADVDAVLGQESHVARAKVQVQPCADASGH
mmetsp:Transcript_124193/g.362464  ORF Transcript_124193/g.362464 Transcript_124193/m.362464 type:complete len:228 (+) Transcript_124193:126-809(+)